MKDLIIDEILRERTPLAPVRVIRSQVEAKIPTASRYPRSQRRAELELSRQPWARDLLARELSIRAGA